MTRLVFDLETDGLLDEVTRVHSLCAVDLDTDELHSFGPDRIAEGLDLLRGADELVAHNGIKYDMAVLDKLFGFRTEALIRDTLVLTRLIYSHVREIDGERLAEGFPRNLYGSHSLEAWGHRLGLHKGDFKGPWETWTPEMQTYCEQDVRVTAALYRYLKPHDYSAEAIDLEHDVATLCAKMERNGFPFDIEKAGKLQARLAQRREELRQALQEMIPPWELEEPFTPKVNNAKLGYQKGIMCIKKHTVTFNPASRHHIADRLKAKYGWQPDEVTETGMAKIDDEVLAKLDFPEAKLLAEYFMVEKRLGQLAEGNAAWLKLEKGGRIHGSYNTNGAVTGRATHAYPNIAQVPGNRSPYGHECRELFHVPRGWIQVGADMSGLELRCLAGYMAHFDGGAYARVVTEGDVHTANQMAAGLETRDQAKTFIYAFLYGAGDAKIGSVVGKGPGTGKRLKAEFLAKTPALKTLRERVSQSAAKGYLKGLDGRRLYVRSAHAALNTLLQSAGALLCKSWIVDLDRRLRAEGLRHGWDGDFTFLAWVHDEVQIACKEGLEDVVGRMAIEAAQQSGDRWNFRCPLTAEYRSGRNWSETH